MPYRMKFYEQVKDEKSGEDRWRKIGDFPHSSNALSEVMDNASKALAKLPDGKRVQRCVIEVQPVVTEFALAPKKEKKAK